MKRILLFFILMMGMASICFADTVYLKSGRAVQGDILEKTEDQIKINANGVTLTYYMDEVDRVENASTPLAEESLSIGESISFENSSSARYASLSKQDLILKYIEATGAKGNMRRTFSEIIEAAPPEKKEKLRKFLNLDEVMGELVPVYDQYFTVEDLQALIAFYESPLGQKVLKTAPLILKDSMEKSMQYFKGKLQ